MSDTVISVENLSKRYLVGHPHEAREYLPYRDSDHVVESHCCDASCSSILSISAMFCSGVVCRRNKVFIGVRSSPLPSKVVSSILRPSKKPSVSVFVDEIGVLR